MEGKLEQNKLLEQVAKDYAPYFKVDATSEVICVPFRLVRHYVLYNPPYNLLYMMMQIRYCCSC